MDVKQFFEEYATGKIFEKYDSKILISKLINIILEQNDEIQGKNDQIIRYVEMIEKYQSE